MHRGRTHAHENGAAKWAPAARRRSVSIDTPSPVRRPGPTFFGSGSRMFREPHHILIRQYRQKLERIHVVRPSISMGEDTVPTYTSFLPAAAQGTAFEQPDHHDDVRSDVRHAAVVCVRALSLSSPAPVVRRTGGDGGGVLGVGKDSDFADPAPHGVSRTSRVISLADGRDRTIRVIKS